MQPVEHQSTATRKCVQQEWSSTGKTADAVGSAFQTAGPRAVDDPLLLPEREVHAKIGINWLLDQEIPKGGYVRILAESLLWEERLGKTRLRTTEGLTTCMEPHRGWTIASSSWIFLRKRWLDREQKLITVIREESKHRRKRKKLGMDHQRD